MTFKELKHNKVVKILSNRYLLILLFFVVWMLFFDENSYLNHRELNYEIDKLEDSNEYFKNEIEVDSKIISNLNNPDSLERYAREVYKMKKENEDIYIIEFDTVSKN